MQQVEIHLTDLGKKCNARRLERGSVNLLSLEDRFRTRGA